MKQRIGDRYEFDRQTDIIGRGGMGTVYVGIDTLTGQKVAIKQLKPDILEENPDFVERFSREAEALRRLNHPNIVAVLNTIADDDAHYLIMEYVSGGSLWEEMQNTKPMPIARVLQIALDLSDALTRAHRQKIIHRDLKPANVLIADDGTPRLTDFGVAQIQDKTRVTRTGAVVGTLNYLSPEALNGDPIDERTDIWAFGVMLYEMLAGRSPFGDDNTTALITAILTKPVIDLDQLRPDVSSALSNLVGQMLIKDRDKRIDSIRKVGSELEDIIRKDDSKTNLPPDFKDSVIISSEGRFNTPTPDKPLLTTVKPTPSKPMVTIVKSDTGEEYVMMPKRFANRLPIVVGFLFVLALLMVFLIIRARNNNPDETNITIVRPSGNVVATIRANNNNDGLPNIPPIAPIGEDEYPVMIMPGSAPDTNNPVLQGRIREVLAGIFETDIPFSNIRVLSGSLQNENDDQDGANVREQIAQLGNNERPVLIVRPEQRQNGIYVILQLGDLSRFTHNNFERNALERLVNIEVLVNNPEDIAPFVAGAIAILHSADGDLFEFMRTMTILSQLPTANGQILSAGISASVYGYFANFINDNDAALAFINTALERDGGNALLFMYRSLAYLRQFNFNGAESDITSAQRVGPRQWTLPLYAVATFTVGESRTTNLGAIINIRPDDWFAYYMAADHFYSENDLTSARQALDEALQRNPQMNVVHLLSFIVALREGRLGDAGNLLADLVRLFPDPNFSYRVLTATFGESFAVSILLYSSLANLVIGQYERVITDTGRLLDFVENPADFIPATTQAPPSDKPESLGMTAYLYASDLFMMRGIAFCATSRFDEALEAYTIGLMIDPTNAMLSLLQGEIYFLQGDLVSSNASSQAALGLSDEMDAFVLLAVDDDEDGVGVSCSDFFDAFVAIGRGE